ncbi:MAG: sugar-binding transcriptional regulator [Clostridia bacterium]|nr:sugar-binding transcriptional regulator [Clostridia bacterium]MDD4146097.1 sugar-binding transcriptional regulator [Clostridia bacterium]
MYEQQLMVKVCKMYYQQQLSKTDIAQKLHISRFKVARLIDKAKKDGIVRIQIVSPSQDLFFLEERLESELGLKAVLVVEGVDHDIKANMRELGKGTAKFLLETIQEGDILGVSFGTTVSEVIKALPEKTGVSGIHLVQVAGGLGQLNIIDGMKILNMLGEKLNSEISMFVVPVFVQSPRVKEVLLEDPGIRQTVDLFDRITIALVGIGSWYPELRSNLNLAGGFPQEDVEWLKSKGVVGDVFNHMVDMKGNIIEGPIVDRLMTIAPEKAKKIDYVIAVAGGVYKSHAVLAAVRSGLIDVLITDSYTAVKILQLLEEEKS